MPGLFLNQSSMPSELLRNASPALDTLVQQTASKRRDRLGAMLRRGEVKSRTRHAGFPIAKAVAAGRSAEGMTTQDRFAALGSGRYDIDRNLA